MTPPSRKRNRIVWLGDPPARDIVNAFRSWGFELVDSGEFNDDKKLGNLLAVFIPAGLLAKVSTQRLIAALDNGVVCRVVAHGASQRRSLEMAGAQFELDIRARQAGHPLDAIRRVPANVHQLIRECIEYGESTAPNVELRISCDKPKFKDAASDVLLRRFFCGFHEIMMENLDGGRSGTGRVWRVDARHENGREAEPFLVKIGKRLDEDLALSEWAKPPAGPLHTERDMYEVEVRNYVPFACRPSLAKGGYLEGANTVLLASMFVSRAQRLDDYVRALQSPEIALTGLFVGAMKNWRVTRSEQTGRLGQMYVEDNTEGRVLPRDIALLDHAHLLARKLDESVPTPVDLLRTLSSIKPIRFFECHGHGDLHSRNVFVRAGGTDVVLIDFPYAGPMRASRDPARLEVNLAFDVCDQKQRFLDDLMLHALYKPPLLPCLAERDARDGRIAGIRHVRGHVAGEGIERPEYELSVACHLLRYARQASMKKPNTAVEVAEALNSPAELRLRGTAYLLAVQLIQGTYDSVGGDKSRKAVTREKRRKAKS